MTAKGAAATVVSHTHKRPRHRQIWKRASVPVSDVRLDHADPRLATQKITPTNRKQAAVVSLSGGDQLRQVFV